MSRANGYLGHKVNAVIRSFKDRSYSYDRSSSRDLKVNLICPEGKDGWILEKFGKCTLEELNACGITASMSQIYDDSASINHYYYPMTIGYMGYPKANAKTTFMITHVDTALKLSRIKELTEAGAIGICMSKETWLRLEGDGIRRDRICYINPAQDGIIRPKKKTLGFTYKTHEDNRKRDDMILDICRQISPEVFRFMIMGAGWDSIVESMREMGFEAEYYDEFDRERYISLMPQLDYFCYFGFDEGTMGYLDAVAAGVETIVTPQGYHLDTPIPISYPVETIYDIVNVLGEIEEEYLRRLNFAKQWSWEEYTRKHIEIWKYMLGMEDLNVLLGNRGYYQDGLFSLLLKDLDTYKSFTDLFRDRINVHGK